MTDAAAAAASATGAEGTETVESLQAKLDAATKDAEKWKAMSRKNEDDKKANAEAAKERDALTAKLQAAEDAKLSETDQLKKQLEAVNARVEASEKATKAAEITAMRARIGAEKGLPPAFIGRLTGEDADTIGADADELLKAIPDQVKSVWPDLAQGVGDGTKNAATDPLLATVNAKLGIS